MADGTHIEWTDATWNIVNGCSVLSPGCTNCYAMRLAGTRLKHHPSRAGLTIDTKAGPVWTGEVRFNDAVLLDPIKWKRPRKIFVCAHGDLFHENVPDEWLDKVFAVMALARHHQFQVLTKRPERMRDYVTAQVQGLRHVSDHVDRWQAQHLIPKEIDPFRWWIGSPDRPITLPNVWLGTSVEDQQRAEERVPVLLETPAAVRWISAEPLLGPVDLTSIDLDGDSEMDALKPRQWEDEIADWRGSSDTWEEDFEDWYGRKISCCSGQMHPTLDWIVVGGESGPGARPMHPDWARSLRHQCSAVGVPFLFKQWGEWHPSDRHDCDLTGGIMAFRADGSQEWRPGEATYWAARDHWQGMCRIGKKAAGRLLDGVQRDGYPA
jgi:protein gp37